MRGVTQSVTLAHGCTDGAEWRSGGSAIKLTQPFKPPAGETESGNAGEA